MQNAPKMTTESIITVINWKHKWVKKKSHGSIVCKW